MGCCCSSPHAQRRYRDPADLDEEFLTEDGLRLRTFGKYRGNGVIAPDDIDGLPSTRQYEQLATLPDTLLYEAEIDNGFAWRCLRPCWLSCCSWPFTMTKALAYGECSCDEICCWVRKEYSVRNYYRIYPNRIEVNNPGVRIPFGYCGCGSWNGDRVVAHPFDRGAFGFRRVPCGSAALLLCLWPCFGDVVARQRCQCNGPLWNGGWWCDEWFCNMFFCVFRYDGLADGDEVAFASNIALQAYFEGRPITPKDMQKCLEYWRQHASEFHDPVGRKRPVLCDPICIPCFPTTCCYQAFCQCERRQPYKQETKELKEAYEKYATLRQRQIDRWTQFKYPQRQRTCCQLLGCRRAFGRRGFCFCTEGCNDNPSAGCCYHKLKSTDKSSQFFGKPFPPPVPTDWDDEFNAVQVLQAVLGDPPPNILYRQWEWNANEKKYLVVMRQGSKKQSAAVEEAKVDRDKAEQDAKDKEEEANIASVNDALN